MRFLPFIDLKHYGQLDARADLMAALSVLFMAVPQGIAYALIAGIPPVMGLYAATIPTIVGSLMRSSHHVITGPTNALSLLFSGALALELSADPATIAITTALLVGLLQLLAGWIRIGAFTAFISRPVVLGYITGAGILIAVGQLPHLTATAGHRGNIVASIGSWLTELHGTSWLSFSIGIATAVFIVALKKFKKTLPSPVLAMILATLCSIIFGLSEQGLRVVQDISPIPAGLPQWTLPDLSLFGSLFPIAFALTVLSLVESNSVARTLAFESHQKLDNDVELSGQGLANITAAFCGGYPISGSPSRSKLNLSSGARTRVAGALSGLMMLGVLIGLGQFINKTPLAALAGLLMIVAWDLIDIPRILATLRSSLADKISFLITLIATCTLSLDVAIYTGISISLLMTLHRRRPLKAIEISNIDGALHTNPLLLTNSPASSPLRVIELHGKLVFATEKRLRAMFQSLLAGGVTRRVVIHLNEQVEIDFSIATALIEFSKQLHEQDGNLLLSGLPTQAQELLRNIQALSDGPCPQILPGSGPWTIEKHQKVQEISK